MKRKFKTLLSLVLAATCALGCTACSSGGGNTDQKPEGTTNPFVLKVFNFNGGYGSEWLTALESRYEKEKAGKEIVVDGKTYDGVDVKIESVKKTMEEMVTSYNFATNHVYFQEDIKYMEYLHGGKIFEDATDALVTPNPYDGGKTLESKLYDDQKNYYKVNGSYYGIPHYAGYVGINYDIDLFNDLGLWIKDGYTYDGNTANLAKCFTKDASKKSAGPDGIKGNEDDGLPTTYDEFFMLCGYIAATDVPLMFLTDDNRQTYLNWFISSLAASYEGREQASLNYTFDGTATNLVSVDGSGNVTALPETKITSENGYELAKQAGKYYGLHFIEEIVDGKWYYNDEEIGNDKAHRMFIQGTNDDKKAAMLIDGVWWENESNGIFKEEEQFGGKGRKDRNYGFMPLPAATAEKAEERRAALAAGKKGYSLLDTHSSLCFIGKGISADEKKVAIDFIQYAYTDVSLAEFSKLTDTTRALKYTMSNADKAEMSAYGRSIITLQEKSEIVYAFSNSSFYQNNESTLGSYKDMFMSEIEKGKPVTIALDQFLMGRSAKEYFDGIYQYRQGTLWNQLVK